ncbi:hypothetical protein BGX29_006525 [Mortierella sp. GBA35]|nr:hypothetical protein BGX29_006525 [Mortierella sp. GBA35]
MASIVQVQEPLHQFYRSRAFKIKTRLLKAPTSATKHKGIDKVIHAARCVDRWEIGQIRPLFVVGDGDFRAKTGSTLHLGFIRLLKTWPSNLTRRLRQEEEDYEEEDYEEEDYEEE